MLADVDQCLVQLLYYNFGVPCDEFVAHSKVNEKLQLKLNNNMKCLTHYIKGPVSHCVGLLLIKEASFEEH